MVILGSYESPKTHVKVLIWDCQIKVYNGHSIDEIRMRIGR